ncbi:hypothetical protein BGZ63DRAFT_188280 [Mariannaea sp. PMI_226]|nr:hypothetical protein BGZ63DRAFT_188280 [Mariannaea sp. PMI_226]
MVDNVTNGAKNGGPKPDQCMQHACLTLSFDAADHGIMGSSPLASTTRVKRSGSDKGLGVGSMHTSVGSLDGDGNGDGVKRTNQGSHAIAMQNYSDCVRCQPESPSLDPLLFLLSLLSVSFFSTHDMRFFCYILVPPSDWRKPGGVFCWWQ